MTRCMSRSVSSERQAADGAAQLASYHARLAEAAEAIRQRQARQAARLRRGRAIRKFLVTTLLLAVISVPGYLIWQAQTAPPSNAVDERAGLPGFVETEDFSFVLPATPTEGHTDGAFAGVATTTSSWTVDTGVVSLQVSATNHARTLHADLAQIAISTSIDLWMRDRGGVLQSEQEFETDAGTARRTEIDLGGGRVALNEQYANGPWIVSIWAVGVGLSDATPEYAALVQSLDLR